MINLWHIGLMAPYGDGDINYYMNKYCNSFFTHIRNEKALTVPFVPDIIFMQVHGEFPQIRFIRERYPNAVIITWNGDKRDQYPQHMKNTWNFADFVCHSNGEDVSYVRKFHPEKAKFLITSYNDLFYKPTKVPLDERKYDCCFVGNNYKNVFPLSQLRIDVVEFIRREFPNSIIYGNGFTRRCYGHEEIQAMSNSKCLINLSHFHDVSEESYTSNRLWKCLGVDKNATLDVDRFVPQLLEGRWDILRDEINKRLSGQHKSDVDPLSFSYDAMVRKILEWSNIKLSALQINNKEQMSDNDGVTAQYIPINDIRVDANQKSDETIDILSRQTVSLKEQIKQQRDIQNSLTSVDELESELKKTNHSQNGRMFRSAIKVFPNTKR